MIDEKEELIQFANLEKVKKMLIEELKFDVRFGIYSVDGYNYTKKIQRLLRDYAINKGSRFRVDSVVTPIDEYSAKVLIFGTGVNDTFTFNARIWIRENKLKNLL